MAKSFSKNYIGENPLWRKGEKIKRICPICGKEFKTIPSIIKNGNGKYCSRECYGKSKVKKVKRRCEICGEEFEAKLSLVNRGGGKYCSRKCYHKSHENKVKCKCKICGKIFEICQFLANKGKGKYCSMECLGKSKLKIILRKCEICGKEFAAIPSVIKKGFGKYCSKKCQAKGFSGENNPSWTGGISKEYCEKFNDPFKRRVAAFWYLNNKNICPVCEKPIIDETPHCHHAYYDKKSCCLTSSDGKYFCNLGIKNNTKTFEIIGDPNKFVPLHRNCHGKTTSNKEREFYARKFETIINEKFNGKSYFTEEEYKEFLIFHPEWKIPYKYYKKKEK